MKSHTELADFKVSDTDKRHYLVEGERVSVTMHFSDTLRDTAKVEAALRGMSFSAFIHACMIKELAKKGN